MVKIDKILNAKTNFLRTNFSIEAEIKLMYIQLSVKVKNQKKTLTYLHLALEVLNLRIKRKAAKVFRIHTKNSTV